MAAENAVGEFQEETRRSGKGRFVFEGLTSLMPIYGKLEDGAEVLWAEHRKMTVGKLLSWVKRKSELEAFDDTPAKGDLPHR